MHLSRCGIYLTRRTLADRTRFFSDNFRCLLHVADDNLSSARRFLIRIKKQVVMQAPCCPQCAYSVVVPTRTRWFDWLLMLMLVRRYRCNACREPFYGPLFPGP